MVKHSNDTFRTDSRELAAYTYAEAGRLLSIPASTIRAWKRGQTYTYKEEQRRFEEPIPTQLSRGLSYFDLVEVFILRSLRREYKYELSYIRDALQIAQEEYGIDRLFLNEAFRHDGREFFLDRLTDLATLSPSHQLAMRTVLDAYLRRVEYGPDDLADSFYPVIPQLGVEAEKLIVIKSTVSFGRPVVERRGIRTSVVVGRINAGETPEHVAEDFGLTADEIGQAILLEAA
jgi:uncharacterized protein (DUF433 family)